MINHATVLPDMVALSWHPNEREICAAANRSPAAIATPAACGCSALRSLGVGHEVFAAPFATTSLKCIYYPALSVNAA